MLKKWGEMSLGATAGGWAMVAEMLSLGIKLSVRRVAGVDIAFPEDKFMNYVCAAKDANANYYSVLTSAVNSALQLGQADVHFMYLGASNVDTNADAMLTTSLTAVTRLLSQIKLYSLYFLLVSHQVTMCQTNGMLSILDAGGITVRLQSASLSGGADAIAGRCLTMSDATMTRYPSGNAVGIGYMTSRTLQNAMHQYLIQSIEPFVHAADGVLTYAQGVIHEMGRVVMALSTALCNPPNYFLSAVVTCACGDTPLAIPSAAKAQTWREHALWCSGTLGMVDGGNQPFVVYNKYSYAQLQAKASGMQAYVDCASTTYNCDAPSDDEFSLQGVTLLNVLVKCRENYAKRQWDPMAYVLFDPTQRYRFQTRGALGLATNDAEALAVRSCLAAAASAAVDNSGCLDQHLAATGGGVEAYWAYQRHNLSAPEYTDACMTFTGAAAQGSQLFANCTDGAEGQCALSSHIWSPASANAVPVGQPHVVLYSGLLQDSLIERLYQQAQDVLFAALDAATARWQVDQKNVQAEFFSAEGDVIHQILDCIFLGPYARVDYWPIPTCEDTEDCPNGPYWARDRGGTSRGVDPYTCVTNPTMPFTCGSPARQSMVRYFVKTYLAQGAGQTSVFQRAIKSRLEEIRAQWQTVTPAHYGCLCADATRSIACCALPGAELFPASLAPDLGELPTANIMAALNAEFERFYDDALQTQEPWLRYLDNAGELASYNWNGSRRVRDEARYDPKSPVYEYEPSEANSPLVGDVDSSLWDVCHSALKQAKYIVFLSLFACGL
jgi:hypothetical protein